MLLSRGQINNTRCIAVVFYILYTDTKRVLLKPFLGSSVVFICIQIFLHSVLLVTLTTPLPGMTCGQQAGTCYR